MRHQTLHPRCCCCSQNIIFPLTISLTGRSITQLIHCGEPSVVRAYTNVSSAAFLQPPFSLFQQHRPPRHDQLDVPNIFNDSSSSAKSASNGSSSSSVDPLWRHPRRDLPSAQNSILVELSQQTTPRCNERASQLLMTFGHFLAHDVTRTQQFEMTMNTQGEVVTTERMDIECDMIETRARTFLSGGNKVYGIL